MSIKTQKKNSIESTKRRLLPGADESAVYADQPAVCADELAPVQNRIARIGAFSGDKGYERWIARAT